MLGANQAFGGFSKFGNYWRLHDWADICSMRVDLLGRYQCPRASINACTVVDSQDFSTEIPTIVLGSLIDVPIVDISIVSD